LLIKERKRNSLTLRKANFLGDRFVKINGANRDVNGNYVSDKGMPWAISLIHDFKVLKKKSKYRMRITFIQWANSGGTVYNDWYKDNPAIEILTKFRTNYFKKRFEKFHS
jgi:hypothetical protein